MFAGGHFYLAEDPAFLPVLETVLLEAIAAMPKSILFEGFEPRFTSGKCVHELVDGQALRTPAGIAIVDAHRDWTYSQVKEESDLAARYLQRQGVRKGDIVGSYMPHCGEYIVSNLAIFNAGGCIFPLETNYPRDLIAELAEMAEIGFILTSSRLRANLPPAWQLSGPSRAVKRP